MFMYNERLKNGSLDGKEKRAGGGIPVKKGREY